MQQLRRYQMRYPQQQSNQLSTCSALLLHKQSSLETERYQNWCHTLDLPPGPSRLKFKDYDVK